MSFFEPVASIVRNQHGVVTRSQLRDAGISERRIRTLVESGIIRRTGSGLFVATMAPPSWEQDLTAAILSVGNSAVASHRSAAALWNLHRFRRNHIDVTVPRWRRRARTSWTVHESLVLPEGDRTVVDRIPVTTPTRTLLDMGRYLGDHRLGSLIDDAVRRDLTSYEALNRRLSELGGRGRPGIATARRALGERFAGAEVPDSSFEHEVRTLLRSAELPEPVLHHRVTCEDITYVLDLAWPLQLVAVECDGFRFHRTEDQLVWDDERRTRLSLLGWTVLHATWRGVRREPERLVSHTRRALRASGATSE